MTLYTRDVLALATSLSRWPYEPTLPLQGKARSSTCGSVISLALEIDGVGRITRLGLQAQACAVGQASAAVFADAAIGCDAESVRTSKEAIGLWLKGDAGLPMWPGIAVIASARDYPARHGAILLAWEAALDALSTTAKPG